MPCELHKTPEETDDVLLEFDVEVPCWPATRAAAEETGTMLFCFVEVPRELHVAAEETEEVTDKFFL